MIRRLPPGKTRGEGRQFLNLEMSVDKHAAAAQQTA
jgi:hypothetical protein